MSGPIEWLRHKIVASGQSVLWDSRFPGEQYIDPPGDKGLFGPDSPAWRVHSDPSMFVGGLGAVLVQMLHPLAMAGVADHSNWVHDPIRRLSRTSSFVTATTFASTAVVNSIVPQVRALHATVNGTAADGRPYRADDPDLLRWVHTAQVTAFLAAHLRYHPHPLSASEQDRYFREVSVIAQRLGANTVPTSRQEVADYFDQMQPHLMLTPPARDALHVLQHLRLGGRAENTGYRVLFGAAEGLIPPWAQQKLQVKGSAVARLAAPPLLAVMRRARGTPPWLREAQARCAA